MFYPQEIIDQVIDSNNIVEVIGSYVKLTKKGSTYFGLCPFHNEKTPSFSVTDNGSRQMFYCFGCHTGGSVLTFLMKYENYSYTEALKKLADRAGIKLPEPDRSGAVSEKYKKREAVLAANKEAAIYYFHLLKSERGRTAYNYLKERGLSDKTIMDFGLGYSDKYRDDLYRYLRSKGYTDEVLKDSALVSIKEKDTHDLFWNRVMFPIMDTSNRVIAFGGRVMGQGEPKYLNSPESICFEKSRNLYGLNIAKKHRGDELILCEGYMDVISLHQAGFSNAVASLGTALTDKHAGVLKRYTDNVLISYDSDGAGQDAALRAIPKLKNAGINVKIVNLHPYKDPDELIKALGADEYRNRLKTAVNSLIFETDVLMRSFNLEDPGEKTRFGNEVASRLSYLDDELERENYLQVISAKYGLDHDVMNSKVKKLALGREGIQFITRTPDSSINKKDKPKGALELNQKMLLAALANEPSLYGIISRYIDEKDFHDEPYRQIADILFASLRSGKLNLASVISIFETSEEQEKAAEILGFSFEGMSDEEKKKVINDCVIRLKTDSAGKAIESENDLNRILELKKHQETLKRLNIFEE